LAGSQLQFRVGGGGGGGGAAENVYTTDTAPDEVATAPVMIAELTLTLYAEAKAALLTPAVALAVLVGSAPEDPAPITIKVVLEGDHVTPAGPAGAKVTFTTCAACNPNW